METGKMEDERREEGREGDCVWVLCTRGTSALQHSSSVCVFVCMRERVSKGGGTLGTPPALQQVVCFYECVCMCVFSSPHTTNGSSSHPAHRPPLPLVAMETHLERAPQRGAYSSSSSFRPLLSSFSRRLCCSIPVRPVISPFLSTAFLPFISLPLSCRPPHQSPGLVYGLYTTRDQTHTHNLLLSHTHPHSYSLGMGGLTGTGKASNGR